MTKRAADAQIVGIILKDGALSTTPIGPVDIPAEILLELYAALGDARTITNWIALATQALVVLAILAGIMAPMKLHARRFAVPRAL